MNSGAASAARTRIVLVDDSRLVLRILERIIEAEPGFAVVGMASDGREALSLIERLGPDMVCTDLNMPGMDGLELTRHIMRHKPLPILVISDAFSSQGPNEDSFRLLQAGAIDVFPKPRNGFQPDSDEALALRRRIRLVAGVRLFTKHTRAGREPATALANPLARAEARAEARVPGGDTQAREPRVSRLPLAPPQLIAIGASTGGPQALGVILPELPATCPPILCAQHISNGFTESLAAWLDKLGAAHVKVATHQEKLQPGTVYLAPENHQLTLSGDRAVCSQTGAAPGIRYCPSVNLLFESVAAERGEKAVGVLLSGMGDDGAEGLRAMSRAGAFTIGQDELSCVVYGMPRVARALGGVEIELPAREIGSKLAAMCRLGVVND